MMPAAKHFDPLIGVDIHMIQPPGPVPPVPIPHPFIGMVIDPMEYAPIIGGTVKVNSMMRAVAGTGGKCLPPHIPIGGVFVKPPANEAEMFMGSMTVDFDGDPASYMALPALSCHDIGMPSPPRMKKHTKPKSLELPTTVVLPIPAGPPVLIGGPPTISLMGIAGKIGMAALGKAFKALMKTKLAKKFMAGFKKARQKAFGKMKPGFLKCKVLKAEPVNSITGEVVVEAQDFALPGPLPIEWNRTYGSQSDRPGLCGYGWQTPADARLVFEADGTVTFADGSIGTTSFPELPANGSVQEEFEGAVLTNRSNLLTVRTKAGLFYHFPRPQPGASEVLVESIRDRRNNPLHFARDENGLRSIADNSGRRIEVTSRRGRIEEMSLHHPADPNPRLLVRYEYDTAGDLVAVYDPLNAPNRLAYKNHLLIKQTDRNGLSFYWEYDEYTPKGRCIHPYGDGGLYNYRFEYDKVLQETRITDSLGHKTTIQFDERFLPINEIDALGGVTSFEYDEAGRTTAVVDPVGNKTEYEYDERGNPTKFTMPDGAQLTLEYDADGQATKIIDANGFVWEQKWDQRGLMIEKKSPLGSVFQYNYDATGSLRSFVDPRGAPTHYEIDEFNNVRAHTDALGNRTEFAYDVFGKVLKRVEPGGGITTYQRDHKSRLTYVKLPSQSTLAFGYDAENNMIRYTDQNGAETRLEYRGLGQIARRIQPDGFAVEYWYDSEERLITIVNQRNESYRLMRDELGRIIEEVDFWGQSRKYTYNACGHLHSSVDPCGQQINYETDPVGRIVKKTLPNRSVESFAFDKSGNLLETKNENGAVARVFDAAGRMIKETQGDAFVIEFAYDECGNRITRKTSLGNRIDYTYDPLNLLASVGINGSAAHRIERDAAGQTAREHFGDGLSRQFLYDAEGRTAKQTANSKSGPLFSMGFEYDRVGNLVGRIDSAFGTDRLKYDPVGRITEHVDARGTVDRYSQDVTGEVLRTRVQSAGDTWRRDGESSGAQYQFDRIGNLVTRNGTGEDLQLAWDASQQVSESRVDAAVTRYSYDSLGRRIIKESAGVRTRFFWDEDAIAGETVIDERDPSSPPSSREYVYYVGTFVPLALIDSHSGDSRVFHYHNDPNGCPRRLTSSLGQVEWAASYSAFGSVAQEHVHQIENPLRLQGQYYDRETGLHYNRHRYYEPNLGQFISQDPLRMRAGPLLYTPYPNPWNWIDPLGLEGEGCKKLVRYGSPDSAQKLADDAAAAEKVLGHHGVSTVLRKPPDFPHGQADFDAVAAVFPVVKTGGRGHYTVVLPKPVTQEVADLFNSVFKVVP